MQKRRAVALLAWAACLLAVAACSNNGGPAVAPAQKKAAPKPVGPPLFEDITAASGVNVTYRNGEDTADHMSILESLGGGVGVIDYDGDGWLDLFFPGGGGFTGADKQEIIGFPCQFYRNLGNNKFQEVTAAVGLDKLAGDKPWFYTHGVAVADYDRDSWPDLLVTGWKQTALLRNVPVDRAHPKSGRRFEDVTAQAGLGAGIDWTTSAAFGDLDGDGYPDLYLCQYVDWSWKKNPKCNYDGKTPDVCPPRNFDGLPHKVFLNNGKGGFIDFSRQAGLHPGGVNQSKGLGVVIADVDGDGKLDVYVANDTVDNFLYLNKSKRGQLLFEETGLPAGVARDDRGSSNGSMGVDAGDPERTGKPCLWVTNYENELHALYRNESTPGRPFFLFRTSAVGIAAIGQKYVGWGTGFFDVDLDGWEDLFIANGHAIRFPTGKDSSRKQMPVLLRNVEKRFGDITPQLGDYVAKPRLARGVALADLDNDGRTDLVISHMNEPATILRGTGGKEHHWLGLELVGRDQASAVGARAVLDVDGQQQTRWVKGGGSYMSAGDQRIVFGMGPATAAKVTITWPDGAQEHFDKLSADRYHRLIQGGNGSK